MPSTTAVPHSSTRRQFLAAAGGLSAAFLPGPRPVNAAEKRPNIVFLLTDDQRWDTLGVAGNPIVQTPNLDGLARQGVRFANHFVTTAICCVSRASIFSGLYERCHGVSDFATPLSPEVYRSSYPMRLRGAGYRTGFLGKYGVGRDLPASDYDYFKGFPGQGKYFHEINGKTVHLSTILGDQALEFLGGTKEGQPFCLSVSFKAPHVQDGDPRQFLYDPQYEDLFRDIEIPVPYLAAPRFYDSLPPYLQNSESRRRWEIRFSTPEKFQKSVKGYYRLIYGADVQIGRILQRLRQMGLDENTVILFSGDNGFYLAERGLAGKWYMHEESIRTPMIVRDPRLPESARAKVRNEMSLNIDIAPTILDAAGIKPARSMQGRSLMPLVRGETPEWRKEWYYSHLFPHPAIPKSEGVRTEEWAYFRFFDSEPVYEGLYHVAADPVEENNLAGSTGHQEQLDKMRSRCEVWKSNLGEWKPGKDWQAPAA